MQQRIIDESPADLESDQRLNDMDMDEFLYDFQDCIHCGSRFCYGECNFSNEGGN